MRIIDADAYSGEMRKRQKACLDAFLESTDKLSYTEEEYWGGVVLTFAEAKLTLDGMPTIGGWISVKDRLPDDGERVLVWEKQGFAYVDKRKRGIWEIGANNGALLTHWMPLPEPPKE